MSHGILEILRYFLLGLIWLFFIYAVRMVIVEVRRGRAETAPASGAPAPPPARRPAEATNTLHLRVLEPRKARGTVYDLDGDVTLGRSAGCVVALEDDNFASSLHARIYSRDGELWVEDLGSTNGTLHNGEPITGPERLRRGDEITVGKTVFEVAR